MADFELVAIGTYQANGETHTVYWDGTTLCDEDGGEIEDGSASSLADAKEQAAFLFGLFGSYKGL